MSIKNFTGTIVTQDRTGSFDAFSMSGYNSEEALVRAFRDRARYTTLVRFVGVCITDMTDCKPVHYDAIDLARMIAE